MRNPQTRELVRELISETDHLSRSWYDAERQTWAGRMEALRSTLQRLERHLGAGTPRFLLVGDLDVVYQRIRDMAARVNDRAAREDVALLLAHAEGLRHERPARLSSLVLAHGARRWARRVGIGASVLAMFLAPLAVRRLRRSRLAWGVSATFAAASVVGVLVAQRPVAHAT